MEQIGSAEQSANMSAAVYDAAAIQPPAGRVGEATLIPQAGGEAVAAGVRRPLN